MKRFVLASAALAVAALTAQQALAADYHGPRRKAARDAYVYSHKARTPAWICGEHGNCQPTWGWGADVGSAPLAAVIVDRGPIPIEPYYHPYYACQKPRPVWNGWRWVKMWEAHCADD